MSKVESADLLMKLYELRREDKMREARNWFVAFFPESSADIMQAMINAETSAKFRMVTTYWDMAASFVNHEAIDETMFTEITGEHIVVFSKIEPFLEEMRTTMGPNYLKNLETLIMKQPDAKEMLAARRELMKRWMQARAESAKS
ncbi:hypothetical protein BH10ACI1_BH10ACI1_21140 [soil metagenome]